MRRQGLAGKGKPHPTTAKGSRAVATGLGANVGSVKTSITPKQARFVQEYLIDLNATQAAIRSGYSRKTAEQQGPRLLGNAGVAVAIKAGTKATAAETGHTRERVLKELAILAYSDAVTHYLADDKGNVFLAPGAPEGALRAISSVKRRFTTTGSGKGQRTTCDIEIKLWDKPGTLKLSGRHVGVEGFFDKVEHSGPAGAPIPVQIYMPDNGRATEK
jgi:phage terminase small subunit